MNKADALRITKLAAKVADEKLGEDIVALDVSRESTLADYFLFVTGTSHVHIRALEDIIRESLRQAGVNLTRTDGQRGHVWRALDYGQVIIHLMDEKTREFYAMEKLWERGRPVAWSPASAPSAKPVPPRKPRKKAKTVAKKTTRRR
jgi:ribosome-associated protein